MKAPIAFLCLAGTWCAQVEAGTVVHMDHRTLPDGKPRPDTVIYAQNGQFRMDTLDQNGHTRDFVLVREGSIWQVDVDKRTFYKFDKGAAQGKQAEMEGRMQAMLASLPPEQRAMMEQRMKGMMSKAQHTNWTTKDTGRSDQAGSWSCRVWQLLASGKAVTESCIASASALNGDELVDATHKAAAVASEVLSSAPTMRRMSQQFALYAQADGFPVRTRQLGANGKASDEDQVTSIDHQTLPADKFAIPKGFTQTTAVSEGNAGESE
jgi:hypothetical protein